MTRVLCHETVQQVNPTFSNDRPGVPGPNLRSPSYRRPTSGEPVNNLGFGPNGIAVGAEPLGPVRASSGCPTDQQRAQDSASRHFNEMHWAMLTQPFNSGDIPLPPSFQPSVSSLYLDPAKAA